jgi:NADPH-dependent ferric siderophore reductase
MAESSPARRTPPRSLEVRRTRSVTPHMRRITLGGGELIGFPNGSNGAHIKLFLPLPGQTRPVLPTLGADGPIWPPRDQRPITRTYTVRRYDPVAGELDIDFVLHGDSGPAARWAMRAEPSDVIGIAGPGGPDRVLKDADWYLLAGDMTAIPAIAAALETLPAEARGCALIEIPDAREEQRIETRSQVEVRWLHQNGAEAGRNNLLADAVRGMTWPDGRISATIAGESTAVVAIRDHLRRERGLDRDAIYAVPYWKATLSEEGYHEERHEIMDRMD